MLLHWDGQVSPAELAPNYVPDELDQVSADAAADGMIYSFYGRLSVGIMFNYSGDNRTITLAGIFSHPAAPSIPRGTKARHCFQTAVLPYFTKQSPVKKTCGGRHGGQPCLLPH